MNLASITHADDLLSFRFLPDGSGPIGCFVLPLRKGDPITAVAEKLRFAASMLEYMNTDARGSGRTSRQIVSAPSGAYYIVGKVGEVHYVNELLKLFGRKDVTVMTRDALAFRLDPELCFVIDHAAELTARQREALQCWTEARAAAAQGDYVSGADPVPHIGV